MTQTHRSTAQRTARAPADAAPAPWQWLLRCGEARTLDAQPVQRWLVVAEGSVWLTRRDSHGLGDDDVWLGAGDSLVLEPGSAWVLQAWPQARLGIAQALPARAAPRLAEALRRWWRSRRSMARFATVLHA
jgi:hypothetical protein